MDSKTIKPRCRLCNTIGYLVVLVVLASLIDRFYGSIDKDYAGRTPASTSKSDE
jgi:hypothetical protein